MIILGIDPGFERLGIAVLQKPARNEFHSGGNKNEKEKLIFSLCFKTSSKLEFTERLYLIGVEIKKIIKKYKPEILSIETLFLNTNQKTVMHVSEVRGVIIYEAKSAGLRIFEATPPQIKIATTGYGRATKEQMKKMIKILLPINSSIKSDDELDAIAIALTASAHMRF